MSHESRFTDAEYHRVKGDVRSMLDVIDPDPHRGGIESTPKRVAKMWINELTTGYDVDVGSLFRTFPDEGYGGMVVVLDIPVVSVCEHHLLPIVGYAHIGYIPSEIVTGLSKLARVVDAYARRLQVQERLTQEIHDAINEHLTPKGVAVQISAEHACMTVRGVQTPGTKTVTCSVSGAFKDNKDAAREEFFHHVRTNGRA